MKQVTSYNPERDIQVVDPTGYVDLVKANQNSSIDVPLALVEAQYNNIEDPKSVGTRPSDVFEEMQANRAIVDYKAPSKGETSV